MANNGCKSLLPHGSEGLHRNWCYLRVGPFFRDRAVEENLNLFERMKAGESPMACEF